MTPTIEAAGLRKRFGKGDKAVDALDGLDLTAEPGQVVALLGPNGAGKTTFVRTVATLVNPDAGDLRVAGIDVRRRPEEVRRVIGLAGQYAAVEPAMTGRENVEMVARLVGQDRATAKANAFASLKSAYEALKAASTVTGGVVDGCIIRISNCTVSLAASMAAGTYNVNGEVVVEADPLETKASCIFQFGAVNAQWKALWIRFRNLTIQRNGAFGINASGTTSRMSRSGKTWPAADRPLRVTITPRSLNAFSIVCCVDENAQRSRLRCRVKRGRVPHDMRGAAGMRMTGAMEGASELQPAVAVQAARHVRCDDFGDLFVGRFGRYDLASRGRVEMHRPFDEPVRAAPRALHFHRHAAALDGKRMLARQNRVQMAENGIFDHHGLRSCLVGS